MNDENVGEVAVLAELYDLLDIILAARAELGVWNDGEQLVAKLERVLKWSRYQTGNVQGSHRCRAYPDRLDARRDEHLWCVAMSIV